MTKTAIEWADEVWNPVTGCSRVSEGCRNCYAKTLHDLRHQAYQEEERVPEQYTQPFETVQLHSERLEDPLHWKRPRRVFVNSMGDLFHEDVPNSFLPEVFAIMAIAREHTFMVLTKRPERMAEVLNDDLFPEAVGQAIEAFAGKINPCIAHRADEIFEDDQWPLPNVWLGVSAENQEAADKRIPLLLQTPAAVRFVSCEPLLGPVNLRRLSGAAAHWNCTTYDALGLQESEGDIGQIDWVIVGGESGPKARPMQVEWARSSRDQCVEAHVPFFFKQFGEYAPTYEYRDGKVFMNWVGKRAAGRLLDGREWNEFPGGVA